VVRNVTGFDRVMLYRFDTRYNGQVLAESTRDGIGSFLGLYFPSRDISPQARDLYLRNFTRYIPDIGAPFHALHSAHGLGSALSHTIDLSYANLRNVQACHIDYLKNMGVQASMSFSINVDNRLWGLFACHHYAPKLVSYEQRVVCEQTAMMFIYKLTAMSSFAARTEQRNKSVQRIIRELEVGSTLARRIAALDSAWGDQDEQKLAQPMVARALAAIYAETSWLLAPGGPDASTPTDIKAPENVVSSSQQALLDLVDADSAAIIRHGQVYRIGNAPETMAIYAIASMFGRELPELQQSDLPVFATDNLTGMVPVAAAIKSQAAGVLAVALSDNDPAYLLWFRGEQVVHATWAGNPIDEKASGGATDSNPRASFAAWQADIRDLSKPWVLEDVEVAYQLVSALRKVDGQRPRAQADVTHALWPAQQTGSSPIRDISAQSGAAVSTQSGRRIIRVGQF
jgi:light-regulated signal transduction histidine kinase (bacteriophytochrome)